VRVAAAALTAALLCGAPATAAGKQVVKLATLAPQGSLWDTALREMSSRWKQESGGAVELRLYPGGVAGDEADVVRKMRIGQFQAAALTVTGLSEIAPSFSLFQIPMLIESWDEVDHVLGALGPDLERDLEQKGYALLLWGHGGWIHLFARQPIRTVDDLRRQKLFVWAGSAAQVDQWRAHGFQPVPLAATDVTMGIQTKMIDVVPTTPIAALSLQWYRQTPYMTELGLAPLVGGVVIAKAEWEAIDPGLRARLAAIAAETGAKLSREVPKQDASAIEQMKQRGLEVIAVDAAQRAEWRRAAESFASAAREEQVPPAILRKGREALAAFRNREPKP